jgi:hypothetical protein
LIKPQEKAMTSKQASARSKGTRSRRKSAAKRELIDTGRDKRYVRRDPAGKFHESDDVGQSRSRDRKRAAKRTARRGQGDKGDRK